MPEQSPEPKLKPLSVDTSEEKLKAIASEAKAANQKRPPASPIRSPTSPLAQAKRLRMDSDSLRVLSKVFRQQQWLNYSLIES